MNKKNNNKGFTLAELLIVVAIIAVLVAIAIPVFTTQLERSKEATDAANIRAAYAEVMTYAIAEPGSNWEASVVLQQQKASWQNKFEVAGIDFTANNSLNNSTKPGSTITISYTKGNGDTEAKITIGSTEVKDNWSVTST